MSERTPAPVRSDLPIRLRAEAGTWLLGLPASLFDMDDRYSRTATSTQRDWPAHLADSLEDVVRAIRERAIRPVVLAARAVVFGVIVLTMAIVTAVLIAVATVRLLDVYAFGNRVWASDALVGTLLCAAGVFAWSRRYRRETDAR